MTFNPIYGILQDNMSFWTTVLLTCVVSLLGGFLLGGPLGAILVFFGLFLSIVLKAA